MTVCAVLQSSAVKVRLAGDAVTSVLSTGSLMVTVTTAVGALASTTVYVPVPPSSMLSAVSETDTPAPSLRAQQSRLCEKLKQVACKTTGTVGRISSTRANAISGPA